MENCVTDYLLKRGYRVNTTALELIQACDDWYANRKIPEFHRRNTVQNVPYDLKQLNLAKRCCSDDANLCEILDVNAGSTEQQKDFLSLFEQMNVLIWSKRFNEYNGETLQISGTSQDNDRFIVDSLIQRPGGKSVSVQWAVRQVGGSFKIVDITVEGVSMVITNRSDYASAIQAQGGKIDGMLNVMRQKVASLKAERGLP